ncbi:MAG: 16S rRNA pseudouridine(516) synthase, partial [Ruminococcus sp.]|nr:16S rRNA pseudouridine(516) synthase [Ruminococcus sp.]
SDVKKLIRNKSVTIDGQAVLKPEYKVDPENCEIKVRGQAVEFKKYVYIMMNKPSGVVSATEDNADKTVIDLVPKELFRKGLFPAGRLDKDTEGLLIITDDGDFAHKILSPKSHVYKRYYAELDGEIPDDAVLKFKEGIVFSDGTKCLPAKLEIADKNSAYVEICEGKFHQVKKMFAVLGLKVTYLKRLKIGSLKLDGNLHIGECRELTKIEKNTLFIGK